MLKGELRFTVQAVLHKFVIRAAGQELLSHMYSASPDSYKPGKGNISEDLFTNGGNERKQFLKLY